MTKHEPAETRRRQIAEALLSSVAEHGIAGATLADVADRAGVSVGLVQRHFRTKDELLRFGIEHVEEQAVARVQALEITFPLRGFIQQLLECFLPLDQARAHEQRFWLTFLHRCYTDEAVAAIYREATTGMIVGLEEALAGAQRREELAADVDVDQVARSLVAFVDGLCMHHAADASLYPAESLPHLLSAQLDLVFTGGGR
ncbi:TetR/AcrR family transcriptional regulator [Aeromicrobium sp. CTD01-1L150]|uniref:TetR/AcrR family transcriptional regulator n=1 Tax=Aeromicrobium sp. CTD01-1L150 TaxID=3341830 RepID=UPI0035BF2EAD